MLTQVLYGGKVKFGAASISMKIVLVLRNNKYFFTKNEITQI